jgi:hypothetical protein
MILRRRESVCGSMSSSNSITSVTSSSPDISKFASSGNSSTIMDARRFPKTFELKYKARDLPDAPDTPCGGAGALDTEEHSNGESNSEEEGIIIQPFYANDTTINGTIQDGNRKTEITEIRKGERVTINEFEMTVTIESYRIEKGALSSPSRVMNHIRKIKDGRAAYQILFTLAVTDDSADVSQHSVERKYTDFKALHHMVSFVFLSVINFISCDIL